MAGVADVVVAFACVGISSVALFVATVLAGRISRRDEARAADLAQRDAEAKEWRVQTDTRLGSLHDDIGDIRIGMARMQSTLTYLDPRP